MANKYVLAFSIKNVITGMGRRNSFLLRNRQLVALLFTQICRRNIVRVIMRKLLMDGFSLPCKFRKPQGCTWKGFGKSRMNSNHRAIVSLTSSKLDLRVLAPSSTWLRPLTSKLYCGSFHASCISVKPQIVGNFCSVLYFGDLTCGTQ